MQLYDLVAGIVRPLVRIAVRSDLRGLERIPRTGGVIVAANHVSVADPFAVAVFIDRAGRRPRFMAKASLFRLPVLGRLLRRLGQIPVHRYSAQAHRSLADAADAIRAGEVVVIYPEGTTTHDRDYWPMQARTGVARLAIETGADVIPLAQWGPQEFLGRRGRFRPVPRKTLHIRAGAPVALGAWRGAKMDAQTLRACADAIMADVTQQLADIRQQPVPESSTRPDLTDEARRTA